MHLVLVSGSHRPKSQTVRVARYIELRILQLTKATTFLLDLAMKPLAFWEQGEWEERPKWPADWSCVSEHLRRADGFVFLTPEWNGMASPAIKNFFLFCSERELTHKPALIVAISASQGGAYPVAELRMSSYKNTHVCYIPEHIIVRRAGALLHKRKPQSTADKLIRKRIDYAVEVLYRYARALREVRRSAMDKKSYPYGM